ncbi:MAG: SMC-Scp complex subunit ScpB [Candidatus Woesearchaeota archaeon]|nr:SMC-Scp complex subunit ScpB [Candidatus Woesearchaeota archaeon]
MAELKKAGVKSKVEAVLFSVGHKINLDDISKLCRSRKEDVITALNELKNEYDEKQSSLMLVEEGDSWKFTVRDHFIPIVRKIVTETELTRSVLETLAVVAFKYPILQSDLIKIRTNKAYDHLVELEKSSYITRQKHGRTNLIKLTEKFFKYFDLTEEKLKDQFQDFASIAKAIKSKEEEVSRIKEDQAKRAEDLKKEDEKIKKEIESLDKSGEEFKVPLDTYESKQKPTENKSEDVAKTPSVIVEKEKLGNLDVVEEPREDTNTEKENTKEETPDEAPKQEKSEQKTEQLQHPNEKNEPHEQKKKSEGIKLTPDMEAKVGQKVDEMLHGPKKSKEENKEN